MDMPGVFLIVNPFVCKFIIACVEKETENQPLRLILVLENQPPKLTLCMNFLFVREVKLDGCNQFCVRGTYTESASSHCESKSSEGLFRRVLVGTEMVTIIIKKFLQLLQLQETVCNHFMSRTTLSPKMVKVCLFR